jgi:hypothetical protein
LLAGFSILAGDGILSRSFWFMSEGIMAKKDQKICVMMDEDLKDRLSRVAFTADVNGSDLVRSCILLALPCFEVTPSLINIIPTLPVKGNHISA